MEFKRIWAMPNKNTFEIAPINAFVLKYLSHSKNSVDPFARDFCGASITNDLSPHTKAMFHLDAEEFLAKQKDNAFDLALFDPPYSPRQISECYKSIGMEVGMKETQNAALYSRVRDALIPKLMANAIVLSFGWNSAGMGIKRGFEIIEMLLVCHGAAHNDTICLAERKTGNLFSD